MAKMIAATLNHERSAIDTELFGHEKGCWKSRFGRVSERNFPLFVRHSPKVNLEQTRHSAAPVMSREEDDRC